MEEVKRLLKTANKIVESAQITGDDKELVENIMRVDFLTGAYEMCLILEKNELSKELKTLINQIQEEII